MKIKLFMHLSDEYVDGLVARVEYPDRKPYENLEYIQAHGKETVESFCKRVIKRVGMDTLEQEGMIHRNNWHRDK